MFRDVDDLKKVSTELSFIHENSRSQDPRSVCRDGYKSSRTVLRRDIFKEAPYNGASYKIEIQRSRELSMAADSLDSLEERIDIWFELETTVELHAAVLKIKGLPSKMMISKIS